AIAALHVGAVAIGGLDREAEAVGAVVAGDRRVGVAAVAEDLDVPVGRIEFIGRGRDGIAFAVAGPVLHPHAHRNALVGAVGRSAPRQVVDLFAPLFRSAIAALHVGAVAIGGLDREAEAVGAVVAGDRRVGVAAVAEDLDVPVGRIEFIGRGRDGIAF